MTFAHAALPLLERIALDKPVVLSLDQGTSHLAEALARVVSAPRDVVVARAIEDAQGTLLGAVAEGDVCVIDAVLCAHADVSTHEASARVRVQAARVARTVHHLRSGGPRLSLDGRSVILAVDRLDGAAVAHAAVRSARRSGARHVIVVVGMASAHAIDDLGQILDHLGRADFVVLGGAVAPTRYSGPDRCRLERHRRRQRPLLRASARRSAGRSPWTPCGRWIR